MLLCGCVLRAARIFRILRLMTAASAPTTATTRRAFRGCSALGGLLSLRLFRRILGIGLLLLLLLGGFLLHAAAFFRHGGGILPVAACALDHTAVCALKFGQRMLGSL